MWKGTKGDKMCFITCRQTSVPCQQEWWNRVMIIMCCDVFGLLFLPMCVGLDCWRPPGHQSAPQALWLIPVACEKSPYRPDKRWRSHSVRCSSIWHCSSHNFTHLKLFRDFFPLVFSPGKLEMWKFEGVQADVWQYVFRKEWRMYVEALKYIQWFTKKYSSIKTEFHWRNYPFSICSYLCPHSTALHVQWNSLQVNIMWLERCLMFLKNSINRNTKVILWQGAFNVLFCFLTKNEMRSPQCC